MILLQELDRPVLVMKQNAVFKSFMNKTKFLIFVLPLYSPAPTVVVGGGAAAAAASAPPTQGETIQVDDSQPTTSLQIRLSDGSRSVV